MFDLFRSRDKAVRYLLGALLGLVALSLVITLIPGYGSTTAGMEEQVIARIGDEPLTTREVQTVIQNSMRGRNIPQGMVQFYVPQLVDQMITERAVAYQAEQMGFRISDAELANAIRSVVSQYVPAGEIKREDYLRFLQAQGLTIEQFERNMRQNLLLMRLQNLALEGAVVTPTEVEGEFHRRNDKVKVNYVKYTPPADLRSQVSVTPDEIRAYHITQRALFTTPEKRSFDLLIADEAKIGATLQVSEAELRAAYSKSLDRFRTPERVKVRHILIKTTGKNPAEVAAAEKKANDLLKQIRAGGDFAALAKANSEDPGSAEKGGDLDWVTRGQMVPEFEKASFSLQPKQVSDVIKTEYGYHIVQALEKENARVKPFEEVRDQLATEGKREVVFNRMQESLEKARAELKNTSAQALASKYNLTFYHVEKAGKGDSIPEVGTSTEIDNYLAGTKKGDVTPLMQIGPQKMAVAAVTEVFAARPSELAEVENTVREQLIGQKTQQLSDQKVKQTMAAFKGLNGDLQAAAKQSGGEIKTTDFFTSEGAAEGIGPASHLSEAFAKPVGSTIGPFNIGNQVFLVKVAEKQVADAAQLAAQRDSIVLALKQKKAAERKELFEDGIVTRLVREGKVKKNQEAIDRVLANYRG